MNYFKNKIKCNSEQQPDVLKDCKNQKRKKLDNREKRKKTLSQNLDDVKYKCTLVFQKLYYLHMQCLISAQTIQFIVHHLQYAKWSAFYYFVVVLVKLLAWHILICNHF